MAEEKSEKKSTLRRRIIEIIIIILLLLLLLFIWFYISKLNKIKYVSVPTSEIEVTEEIKGYRNIVLFGINDDDEYEGRTGCMIILSLNQDTNEVKMTSIYSDTYVEIPENGFNRMSYAYKFGGPTLAINTLNRNFDLDITEYITINFSVIKDVINALDGVKVTVSTAEAKGIRGITKAGTYNLTGEQVHDYQKVIISSTHENATGYMRKVLEAGLKKSKESSIINLNSALDALLPQVETNIDKIEITKLLTKLPSIKIINSEGWPYEVKRIIIKGKEFGIPNTLEKNVKELHQELFNEEYEVTNTVKEISENIKKKTGIK